MKKTEYEWTPVEKEISIEEMVDEFMESEFVADEWSDDVSVEDFEFFWDNFEGITEEEKNKVFDAIKVRANEEIENYKALERDKLKDRDAIIYFIDNILDYYIDPGDVGYSLTAEEILDTILENGRK